jgi:hypothetical protein
MALNNRFKELCDRFGYEIHPVVGIVNGKWNRRPDIMCVERRGEWEMTIPKLMYRDSNTGHRDLLGIQHPTYFDCEAKLYSKKTGYIYA